jgi:hypothetical protein
MKNSCFLMLIVFITSCTLYAADEATNSTSDSHKEEIKQLLEYVLDHSPIRHGKNPIHPTFINEARTAIDDKTIKFSTIEDMNLGIKICFKQGAGQSLTLSTKWPKTIPPFVTAFYKTVLHYQIMNLRVID